MGNASVCDSCPIDTYSDPRAFACIACPAFSHSTGGTDLTGCLCEAGFQYVSLTYPFTCQECTPGTYSFVHSPLCYPCPPGTASPFYRSMDPSTCVACLAGSYSLEAADYCTLCQPGKYTQGLGLSACTTCDPGYYALENATACTVCQPGQYSSARGAGVPCAACASGTYSPAQAATSCLDCPAGRYVPPDAQFQCLPCPPDFFSENRSYACYPCPDHSHGPGDTAASGCLCDAGRYPFYRARASGGVESIVGATLKQHVFPSATGVLTLYLPTQITAYCDAVPLAQALWPLGTYLIDWAYQGCSQVTLAYSVDGGFYPYLSPTYFLCQPCPSGSFSLVGNRTCTPCAPGFEQPATTASTCSGCAPGYVAPDPGTPVCLRCAPGAFETGTRLACGTCPEGAYSTGNATACLACPANTYSPSGSPDCPPCPPLSVSAGAGPLLSCVCQQGLLRLLAPAFVCQACPDGTFSLQNATVCAECASGLYSTAISSSCTFCASGTYQPSPRQSACILCAPGSLSEQAAPACYPCPAPLYCMGGGHYAPCPLGTYSSALSLQDLTDCLPCPANAFCQTSGDLEQCPAHTSSAQGSVTKLSCLCDVGYQCTYSKAVRVNVTLPLTQAQFDLVRDQFIQAVAAAAGVDPALVSIVGLSLLAPPANQTRRRALEAPPAPRWPLPHSQRPAQYLLVQGHVEGVEHIPVPRLRRGLLLRGLRAGRTRVRQAHVIHARRRYSGWS